MVRKPFAAFGRVLYANYYEEGYTVDAVTEADSKTVLLFTEGDFTVRDRQTGEVVYQCNPGWINYGNYQDRLLVATSNTPSVSWCYDPKVNQGYVPPIELVALKQDDVIDLAVGTNLFLCSGTLLINENQFSKSQQIAIRSGNCRAGAVTDVYGLIFK